MANIIRIKGDKDNCYVVEDEGKAILVDTVSAA